MRASIRSLVCIAGTAIALAPGCSDSHADPGDGGSSSVVEAPLDVTGTWYDCSRTVVFSPGGAASFRDLRADCQVTGQFTVEGRNLTVTWPDAQCTGAPAWHREIVRSMTNIVLVDHVTGATFVFVDDATPRATYRLDATTPDGPRSTTMRVFGDSSSGIRSACYWSSDHACGGLLSCGGGVAEWTVDATHWHAATYCQGSCPCGAQLDATPGANGAFEGSYTGANCGGTFTGHFTATAIPDP